MSMAVQMINRAAANDASGKKGLMATKQKPELKQAQELPAVLEALLQEHRHLTALVRVLERKCRQLEHLRPADYYLMRDIIGYLHDYPDSIHHPTENRLSDRLVQEVPGMARIVEHLNTDHEAISAETEALLNRLELAIEQPTMEREKAIRKASAAFVWHQQAHMQLENGELFPAALEALSASDWDKIQSAYSQVEDPLFGGAIGKSYRRLYEYLIDPVNRDTPRFALFETLSLEKLILTANAMEEGGQAWAERLMRMAREMAEETQVTASRSLSKIGWLERISLPAKYWSSIGRSALECGADLTWIGASTLRKTVLLYTQKS